MSGLRSRALLLAMASSLPAQADPLADLTAKDWQLRNTAATQLCNNADQLDAATLDALWKLAKTRSRYVKQPLPELNSYSLRLREGMELRVVMTTPLAADHVPTTSAELTVPMAPQVLALFVLLQAPLPQLQQQTEQAVELAMKAIEPAEFRLACRLCARLGAPALQAVSILLQTETATPQADAARLTAARVLGQLGTEGRDALQALLMPEVATPARRAILLALQELESGLAAPCLREVAKILRDDRELAGVALGTLDEHAADTAALAAFEELAEGLDSAEPDQRLRSLTALVRCRWQGAALAQAIQLQQEILATGADEDFAIVLRFKRSALDTPIAAPTLARLLKAADDTNAPLARAAQHELVKAAESDNDCLAALLTTYDDCPSWLVGLLLRPLEYHGKGTIQREVLTGALQRWLREVPAAARVERFRFLQAGDNLFLLPAVQQILQQELQGSDPARVDAAAWLVAQYSEQLADLAGTVELVLQIGEKPPQALWSTWVRWHPQRLPEAIVQGQLNSYAASELAKHPAPAAPAVQQQLLELASDAKQTLRLRRRAAAWLTTFGAAAAEQLASLVTNRDEALALWAVRGLEHGAAELVKDSSRVDALELALRAAIADNASGQQQVMVAAVLAALDRLQPADLEPVVAEFHGLVPPATWTSASVDRAGDLDVRSFVRPWVIESALDAIAKIGATECVQAWLALHADPGPRGYLTSDKAKLARRMRCLLGGM